jgi:acid phosphatase (class A)
MVRRATALPVILGILLALNVGAGAGKLHFPACDKVDAVKLLADPPTLNSEEGQAEVDLLLKLQTNRTDAQKARIVEEDDLTVFAFADVLGPWFTAENCPKTAALFTDVQGDAKVIADRGKKHWNRPRPYISNPAIVPCGKLENSAGYPSGHSTRGTIYAEILADIFPDQRAALMERGRQIGWDRVIAGVHYPSDVAAGRVLGNAIAEQLLASPDFQAQLADVKSELESASQPVPAH